MHIHILGICGTFMGGVAALAREAGHRVTGCDAGVYPPMSDQLRALGIELIEGYGADQMSLKPDMFVIGNVVSRARQPDGTPKFPLMEAILNAGAPYTSGPQWLAEHVLQGRHVLAVAGTHGKTTTTSMLATILTQAGLDPTYVVGGRLHTAGSGAKLGSSRYLVAEADESDGSFLELFPTIAVVTNIENDHLEFYGNMKNLRQAFRRFADKVPFYGAVILNHDSAQVRRILPQIRKKVVTYGFAPGADLRAVRVRTRGLAAAYELVRDGCALGPVRLAIGGRHNASNSLAAIAAALEVGVGLETILESLARFALPERRFQVLFSSPELLIVDDYAHHPSEIKATLRTLAACKRRRIVAVFQPHRYTRLRLLMKPLAAAFRRADVLVVAPLYTANQPEIAGVSSRALADAVRAGGQENVHCLESFPAIADFLRRELRPGDGLVFLSAGNLTRLGHEFAAAWKEGAP